MLNPTYRTLVLDQLARFRGTLGYIISHTGLSCTASLVPVSYA